METSGKDVNAAVVIDVLCNICTQFVKNSAVLVPKRKDHNLSEKSAYVHSLEDLRGSAANGCHLCNLTLAVLSAKDELAQTTAQEGHQHDVEFSVYCSQSAQDMLAIGTSGMFAWEHCTIDVSVRRSGLDPLCSSLSAMKTSHFALDRYFARDESNKLAVNDPHPAQLSVNTQSDKCFELAKSWLNECTKKHYSCRPYEGYPLPTRLLDVSAPDASSGLRLVVSENLNHTDAYVVLSYCWGKGQPFVLNKANLEECQDHVDLQLLPKTIHDAVNVTRRLGHRYLWVDSLCIIQDSPEDWNNEAAKMGEIYANGLLTIAATYAPASTIGCFTERNPLSYLPCRIYGSKSNGVYICQSKDARRSDLLFQSFVDEAPLNRRAWVVQERLLSRRILHFTSQGLFWECSDLQAFDSNPTGMRVRSGLRHNLRGLLKPGQRGWRYKQPSRLNRLIQSKLDEMQATGNGGSSWSAGSDFTKSWLEIVSLFTNCGLTKSDDRIPALLGIVTEIQHVTHLEFCAGCWYTSTSPGFSPHHLMWMIGQPCELPLSQRAPSWSWFSVDGPVVFPDSGRLSMREAIDQLEGKTTGHFWQIRSQIINMESPTGENVSRSLVPRCCQMSLVAKAITLPINELKTIGFKPDAKHQEPYPSSLTIVRLLESTSKYARLLTLGLSETEMAHRQRTLRGIAGLVLLKQDGNDDVYHRIGAFEVRPPYAPEEHQLSYYDRDRDAKLVTLELSRRFDEVEARTMHVE